MIHKKSVLVSLTFILLTLVSLGKANKVSAQAACYSGGVDDCIVPGYGIGCDSCGCAAVAAQDNCTCAVFAAPYGVCRKNATATSSPVSTTPGVNVCTGECVTGNSCDNGSASCSGSGSCCPSGQVCCNPYVTTTKPNCKLLSVTQGGNPVDINNLLTGTTYTFTAYYDTLCDEGDRKVKVIMGGTNDCSDEGLSVSSPDPNGGSGWDSFNWTPTLSGTYRLYCESAGYCLGTCRGYNNYVACGAPDSTVCHGPNTTLTVTVTPPTPTNTPTPTSTSTPTPTPTSTPCNQNSWGTCSAACNGTQSNNCGGTRVCNVGPAYQSCPTLCGAAAVDLPDGACGTHHCDTPSREDMCLSAHVDNANPVPGSSMTFYSYTKTDPDFPATTFEYAVYNLDNLYGPNNPKPVCTSGSWGPPNTCTQLVFDTTIAPADHTASYTVDYSNFFIHDTNNGGKLLRRAQINSYFVNGDSCYSLPNANCIFPIIAAIPPKWWQTVDGDVTAANGDLNSLAPTGRVLAENGTGGFPGIPIYNSGSLLNINPALVSSTGWIANNRYLAPSNKSYTYDYFYSAVPAGTTLHANVFPTSVAADDNGYQWYLESGTGPFTLDTVNLATRKAILFVGGDLTITGNITKAAGGFFMVIAKGKITLDPTVTTLQGIYFAETSFESGSTGNIDDVPLQVTGSVVAGTISLQRDLPHNETTPAEVFSYNPADALLFPPNFAVRRISWKEIAP